MANEAQHNDLGLARSHIQSQTQELETGLGDISIWDFLNFKVEYGDIAIGKVEFIVDELFEIPINKLENLMVLPDISDQIIKALQKGNKYVKINSDELEHTFKQALCAKGGEDNPRIQSFHEMCSKTPTMRRLEKTISAASNDSKNALNRMFEHGDEGSFMTDVIGSTTDEDAFKDDVVFRGGPYMGLIRRTMEIVAKDPRYEQQTLDQAHKTMERAFEALDLTEGFTPVIRKINQETMKFMKIQTNCIRNSKNILPKITKGQTTEFIRSVLENHDILAQIVDKKQRLSNGIKASVQNKVAREYQNVNDNYSFMELLAFGQTLDNILEQANAKAKRKEQQEPPSRGTDRTWSNGRGRGGGRGGSRGTRNDEPYKSRESASNMTSNSSNNDDDEKIKCFHNGTARQGFHEPPRWFMLLPSMRRAGTEIDKDKLREQDKKNAKKFKCEDRWKEEDRKYFERIHSGDSDRGEAAEHTTVSAQLAEIKKYAKRIKKMESNWKDQKKSTSSTKSQNDKDDNESESSSDDESYSSGGSESSDELFSASDDESSSD